MSVDDETFEQVRDWLADRIALYLDKLSDELDPEVPLAEYGLDSVYVVSVLGEVEDRYGLRLDPTVVWEYPTVTALAGYLHEQVGARTAQTLGST